MPMIPAAMSAQVVSAVSGLNVAGLGPTLLWNAICDYVQLNAQVLYSWVAVSSTVPPTPDPMVVITAGINTAPGRVLSLPGIDQARDATTALGILSAGMNMAASLWMVDWPLGFTLTPCFIMPSIVLTPSMMDNQAGAMNFLCTQVISGLIAATPATGGNHLGIYNGAGVFTSII